MIAKPSVPRPLNVTKVDHWEEPRSLLHNFTTAQLLPNTDISMGAHMVGCKRHRLLLGRHLQCMRRDRCFALSHVAWYAKYGISSASASTLLARLAVPHHSSLPSRRGIIQLVLRGHVQARSYDRGFNSFRKLKTFSQHCSFACFFPKTRSTLPIGPASLESFWTSSILK